MDIISDKPMAFREIVQAISGKRMIVGAKQLRKALISGSARRVYLAKDADPAITEPIMTLCKLHNVEVAWVRSMTDLGQACEIDVGAAAAAVANPF
jgi:large subunit ribosomal protein L7A